MIAGADESAPMGRAPGIGNVGTRATLTVVYLGNGWVLTARHVGAGTSVFGGVEHPRANDERFSVRDPDAAAPLADLILYRIEEPAGLEAVPLASEPIRVGDAVQIAANGRSTGKRQKWSGRKGFGLGPRAPGWGTNRVEVVGLSFAAPETTTRVFATRFDAQATAREAQGAPGDSGGAVFVQREGRWELAGILLGVQAFPGQPPNTAYFGNTTVAADLYHYREKILEVIGSKPGPAAPTRP